MGKQWLKGGYATCLRAQSEIMAVPESKSSSDFQGTPFSTPSFYLPHSFGKNNQLSLPGKTFVLV